MGRVEPILGPPGTGKTTTLLSRFEGELARGVPPESIAVVTFTRAGVREFLERAQQQFVLGRTALPWVRTIHSAAYRLLDYPELMGAEALRDFRERYGYVLTDDGRDNVDAEPHEPPRRTPDDLLRHAYDWGRSRCLDLDRTLAKYPVAVNAPGFRRFAERLVAFKLERSLLDFTDLLEFVLARKLCPPVSVALIDEAQDLSPLQIAVVEMWFADCERVYVGGDDDQAIYAFQGAEPDWLLGLAAVHEPTVLGQSHRVPGAVHAIAGQLVRRNRNRVEKAYLPTAERGMVDYLTAEQALGGLDANPDALVLVRNRLFMSRIAARLMARVVPFAVEGKGAVSPLGAAAVVFAAKQAHRLACGEQLHSSSLAAVIDQVPSRGANLLPHGVKAELKRLQRRVTVDEMRTVLGLGPLLDAIARNGACSVLLKLRAEHRVYLQALLTRHGTIPTPTIRLTTIHGAKGREADTVIVLPDMTSASFGEYCDGRRGGHEAENRVAYVAVTRAKRRLVLVRPATRRFYAYPAAARPAKEEQA
jgi:superfamily I DNA/RNA helicase